jgi:hypothetical protein
MVLGTVPAFAATAPAATFTASGDPTTHTAAFVVS